ncbi:hypothetical protein QR680_001206 [Steinernema hermaphroditum]|uniref:VWFA domain-containing protein n=1 Tax=Steinernema hermaphroditum TaxID=289476 RepID=A0AA39GXB6_9BILA|nr:hypothetical protein QR680_001206 [Steinernema hermaphroditum]
MLRVIPLLLSLAAVSSAQWSSQTYPDPRADPVACHIAYPGPICDPSEIITEEERLLLADRINKLLAVTQGIKNQSPSCQNTGKNLQIVIALLDRIGTVSNGAVDVEKFTNHLKMHFQQFQDIGMCDTMVVIVNSRLDRQVFTVAGRDTKLSKDVLRAAFERNLGHFRATRNAMGLQGMVEHIVSAYSNAHIVQVPTPEQFPASNSFIQAPSPISAMLPSNLPGLVPVIPSQISQSVTQGVRQREERPVNLEKFAPDTVDPKDRLWIDIIEKAAARCGYDPSKIAYHVRAVIEEAMDLSVQLISDSRYNVIEEQVVSNKIDPDARNKAWISAKKDFIDDLYKKYRRHLSRKATQCPAVTSRRFL